MAGGGSDEDNPVPLNVTPLIDIIFCLIIFFMCSFHFKQTEGKIESWLPKDKGVQGTPIANPVLEEIRVIMTVDENKQVVRKLGGLSGAKPEPSDTDLARDIVAMHADILKLGKDVAVTIDAMPPVPWKDVVNVMNICHDPGDVVDESGQRWTQDHYDPLKIEFAAPLPAGAPGA